MSVATEVGVQVAVEVGANAGVSVGGTGVRVGFHSHPVQQKDQVGLRHSISSLRSGYIPPFRFTATLHSKHPVSERPSAQR